MEILTVFLVDANSDGSCIPPMLICDDSWVKGATGEFPSQCSSDSTFGF